MTTINNINNNSNNNTNNNKNNGGKIMENPIIAKRQAEAKAKEEAAKKAARKAKLEAIEPVDIIGTMGEIEDGIIRPVYDEEGRYQGVNGGELFQKPIKLHGKWTTISAKNPEDLLKLEKEIEAGLQGDGMYHRSVIIGGNPCDCVGVDLEALEKDIDEAEEFYYGHNIHDAYYAAPLLGAGYDKKDLEQLRGSDGRRYILSYKENVIMNLLWDIVANLDDLSSASLLSREDVKTLLVERLEAHIAEERTNIGEYNDFPEDDWDDEYDEENDEYEDDEDDDESMTIEIRLQ